MDDCVDIDRSTRALLRAAIVNDTISSFDVVLSCIMRNCFAVLGSCYESCYGATKVPGWECGSRSSMVTTSQASSLGNRTF